MKFKKYLGTKILQVFAVVVLILALLSSALFFLVNQEKEKAAEANAIPQLFGVNYIALNKDFDRIAEKGDLLLVEAVTAEDVTTGDAVLYETPQTSRENSVYGNFSLGVVVQLKEENGEVVSYIEINGKDGETVAVAPALIKGRATGLLMFGGTIVEQMTSDMGIVWFVALPAFVFVLLQLIVVILRVIHHGRDEADFEEEDDSDDEFDAKGRLASLERDGRFAIENAEFSLDDTVFAKKENKPAEPNIKSQTVSTLKGEYISKSSLLKPFMEESVAAEPEEEAPQENHASLDEIRLQSGLPKEKPAENEIEKDIMDDLMSQATIEFDLGEIRRRLHQEKSVKSEREISAEQEIPTETEISAEEPAAEPVLEEMPVEEPEALEESPKEESTDKEFLEQEIPAEEILKKTEEIDVDGLLAEIMKQVQEQKDSETEE